MNCSITRIIRDSSINKESEYKYQVINYELISKEYTVYETDDHDEAKSRQLLNEIDNLYNAFLHYRPSSHSAIFERNDIDKSYEVINVPGFFNLLTEGYTVEEAICEYDISNKAIIKRLLCEIDLDGKVGALARCFSNRKWQKE